MPDQTTQNNAAPAREAAQFNSDFGDYARRAQQDDAVSWANGIAEPAKPGPATLPASTQAPAQTQPEGYYNGAYHLTVRKPTEGGVSDVVQTVDNRADGQAPGAARDIGLGLLHAPRSVARGVMEGLNSIGNFAQKLNDYLPTFASVDENGNATWLPQVTTGAGERERINKGRQAQGREPLADTIDLPVPADNATPTVTGHVIEDIARFATGFAAMGPIGEAAGIGGALNSGTLAANVGKFTAADLISTDQQEQNLSNVVEKIPALKNPVNDFLSAKPDDGFAESKLKQAINDLPLGVAGEALFKGVGLLKDAIGARKALKNAGAADAAAGAADEGLTAGHFSVLGDASSPDFIIPKTKIEQAAEEVQGAFGKPKQLGKGKAAAIPDYQINFARINGGDDIKQLMDEMVNHPALKPAIEATRRGKRSNAETVAAAQDVDGFQSLMDRRVGEAFNAEQIVAARKVYFDTTAKLLDVAKQAAGPNAGELDQFAFRKMLAIHQAVQKEFMGVRAEAGRALQAWSIPLGGSEAAQAVNQALVDFGGVSASKDLAERLASLGDKLNNDQINMIVEKSALARTRDAVTEAWTLGLLTNPTTHVVNLASNTLTGLMLGVERFGQALVPGSGTDMAEGAAFFQAMLDSQKLALKNAKLAFETGDSGIGLGKIDAPRVRTTARDILDPEGKAGVLSKAIDGYGYFLNKYVGGALGSADEYSKTIMYQAQLRALATRDGLAQGLEGEALSRHVADVLATPPASMRADAVTFAQYATFTKRLGETGQDVQEIIARNPVLRFVAPFVRTPGNIFKFAFERTPLAAASKAVRTDIMAGGVRRATALTRIGMGVSIMSIGADMAQNGHLTGAGPNDPREREKLVNAGWQPYSVKLGDRYYSYARFEPVATILGMSADMAEIMGNYEAYDLPAQENIDQLIVAGAIAASNQVVGKTFLQGFADLNNALSDPGRFVPQFLQKFAGSFVPAGVNALNKAIDPQSREVFNMIDAVRSRIPGMAEFAPKRFNMWGQPIKAFYPNDKDVIGSTAERLLSLFNPVYYSAEKDAPVDRWMLQNGFNIGMPPKVQNFDGVRIDLRDYPQIYSRLVETRGSVVKLQKYGNQTMKQFFDNLAAEKDPFGRHVGFFMAIGENDFDHQQNFINKVVSDYTAAARAQVAHEYGDIIPGLVMQGKLQAQKLNAARGPEAPQTKPLP